MDSISNWKSELTQGVWDQRLITLYSEEQLLPARHRITDLLDAWSAHFDRTDCAGVYSAPGRTELGGNHTDHQHGRVLAASVNVDMLAAAAPNGTHLIRIASEGYPELSIDLEELSPKPEEENTSAALVRGIAAKLVELGYPISGVDGYITSNVPAGSGLSSSAAYEVLVGTILNQLFCGNALSPVQIAQISQYAENVYFGKPCGLMDQMACSVGGAVGIDFAEPDHPLVEQISVPLSQYGYALCIIDCGADHADLTDEYAAIPRELEQVCTLFGAEVLREVPEEKFYQHLPSVRRFVGDRAMLRAIHVFEENKRVAAQVAALKAGDFPEFLELVRASGRSSWMYLQNITPAGQTRQQALAFALAVAERLVGDAGAVRVHGGGFAGTLQAYVPTEGLSSFRERIEAVLGQGCCHVLTIRPEGGYTLLAQADKEV
jgi:galactokinase